MRPGVSIATLQEYEEVMGEQKLNDLLRSYFVHDNKSWTTRRNAKDGMVYDQMFAVLGGK